MQFFSADATIFKEKLNFLFAPGTKKNELLKLLIIGPQFFFQYCQPAKNQPKISDIFHRNLPPCDFSIMTLAIVSSLFPDDMPEIVIVRHNL
jgi:hypothetical protein